MHNGQRRNEENCPRITLLTYSWRISAAKSLNFFCFVFTAWPSYFSKEKQNEKKGKYECKSAEDCLKCTYSFIDSFNKKHKYKRKQFEFLLKNSQLLLCSLRDSTVFWLESKWAQWAPLKEDECLDFHPVFHAPCFFC